MPNKSDSLDYLLDKRRAQTSSTETTDPGTMDVVVMMGFGRRLGRRLGSIFPSLVADSILARGELHHTKSTSQSSFQHDPFQKSNYRHFYNQTISQ